MIIPIAEGVEREFLAGPVATRYSTTFDGETWREVGHREMSHRRSARTGEMTLTRIRDSDRPAAGAVPAE